MDDPRFVQMAYSGISARVDGEIRKRTVTDGPWAELTAERARSLALEQPGLAVLFACHPDGFVRQAAVELACQWLRSPGAAQIVALRTTDPVPAIREIAIAAVGELLSGPGGRSGLEVLPTNVTGGRSADHQHRQVPGDLSGDRQPGPGSRSRAVHERVSQPERSRSAPQNADPASPGRTCRSRRSGSGRSNAANDRVVPAIVGCRATAPRRAKPPGSELGPAAVKPGWLA